MVGRHVGGVESEVGGQVGDVVAEWTGTQGRVKNPCPVAVPAQRVARFAPSEAGLHHGDGSKQQDMGDPRSGQGVVQAVKVGVGFPYMWQDQRQGAVLFQRGQQAGQVREGKSLAKGIIGGPGIDPGQGVRSNSVWRWGSRASLIAPASVVLPTPQGPFRIRMGRVMVRGVCAGMLTGWQRQSVARGVSGSWAGRHPYPVRATRHRLHVAAMANRNTDGAGTDPCQGVQIKGGRRGLRIVSVRLADTCLDPNDEPKSTQDLPHAAAALRLGLQPAGVSCSKRLFLRFGGSLRMETPLRRINRLR